jgi:hypothetical protein
MQRKKNSGFFVRKGLKNKKSSWKLLRKVVVQMLFCIISQQRSGVSSDLGHVVEIELIEIDQRLDMVVEENW